jgi:DNA-directed RNA polymerase subunit omega
MVPGEKILPHPDILNEVEYGRFVLANLAAKRAKQIREGAPPLVRIDSGHPLSIALAEIAAGKIKPILASEGGPAVEVEDLVNLETLDIGDMGLLLPAIEEDLDPLGAVHIEDDEEIEDPLEEPISLGDLLLGEDEDEAEEPDMVESDDAEVSLEGLAEEEQAEEEASETD